MIRKLVLAAVAAGVTVGVAQAATVTGNFTVQVTVNPTCAINSLPNYNFGNIGATASAINGSASVVQFTCSNGLPYAVTLVSANPTAFGSTYDFNMINSGQAMGYRLYAGSTSNPAWDTSVGGTYNAVGSGGPQTLNMFGVIPLQTAPVGGWNLGTYTDTVTMTVTY